MSKVEQFAIEKYPISIEDVYGHKVDVNLWQRKACVEGYLQAEKDLELTWENMMAIDDLLDELLPPRRNSNELVLKGYYEEVLKRFKDLKNGTTKR